MEKKKIKFKKKTRKKMFMFICTVFMLNNYNEKVRVINIIFKEKKIL